MRSWRWTPVDECQESLSAGSGKLATVTNDSFCCLWSGFNGAPKQARAEIVRSGFGAQGPGNAGISDAGRDHFSDRSRVMKRSLVASWRLRGPCRSGRSNKPTSLWNSSPFEPSICLIVRLWDTDKRARRRYRLIAIHRFRCYHMHSQLHFPVHMRQPKGLPPSPLVTDRRFEIGYAVIEDFNVLIGGCSAADIHIMATRRSTVRNNFA